MAVPGFNTERSLRSSESFYFGHSQRPGTRATVLPAQMRRARIFHSCALTCSSEDGKETCCCDVGEKCVRGTTICDCKSAKGDIAGGRGVTLDRYDFAI